MAENSKIEWTHHTFNPWIGCQKVSPGCDNCYAEAQNEFRKWNAAGWGPHASRRRTSYAYWKQPLKWDREAAAAGERRRVFCASLADVFDNHGSITSGWRGDLWHLIARTPNLDWLLLTKRPQNIVKMLPDGYGAPAWGAGWPNVWLGTTAENQEEADRRIPHLLATPAAVRFVSAEPLLGPVNFKKISVAGGWYDALSGWRNVKEQFPGIDATIDWIIVGGESGHNARPMHPDWARDIRDQCKAARIAFFFKQMGAWATIYDRDVEDPDWRRCDALLREHPTGRWLNLAGGHGFHGERVVYVTPVGKKAAEALLDGKEHKEFPR